jgi:Abnormal spindle-like microcephaly-assoc'd, ASPM-SPD-2-Hydin/Beta-propeller repeat
MRVALKCLVALTGLAFAVSILLTSNHIAPNFQTPAIPRFLPRLFAYPGTSAARMLGDPSHFFDPVLVYSTFLGGPNASGGTPQGATALFVDASGNAYIAGTTIASGFPVTPGVVLSSNPPGDPVGFVSKFDPTGQSLLLSTYIPGIYNLTGLAVDPSGNIFVSGQPVSLPIPAGTSPFQSAPKSSPNQSIGILKLNSTATAVLNATYLDGSGFDSMGSIAVDSAGNLYVAGSTTSNDFPTTQGALQTSLGSSAQNGFLTKLNPNLSALIYSTYLGQTSSTSVTSGPHTVAVDSSGNAYVTGYAGSGFPTTLGAVQPSCVLSSSNLSCAFLAKLNSAGSVLTYATYLAPSGGGSQGFAVAVDSSQNAYVGGWTPAGFPEVGSVQACSSLGGFLSEIDASGNLAFSTCLGSTLLYGILDIAVDGSGNVHVVGESDTSLPLKNAIQSNPDPVTLPASGPPFVASITPNTNPPVLLFSSFIGGAQPNELDVVASVGVDSSGNIYATGTAGAGGGGISTFSQAPAPFPVFNALQPIPAVGPVCLRCGSSNAFLMKVSPTDAPAAAYTPALLSFPAQQVGSPSAAQPVTIVDLGSAPLTVSNATVSGDFSIQNNCNTVSSAGGACAIQVIFTPTVTGTRTGTLSITDNSAGSPRTVELTGQGAVIAATVAPSSVTFASQVVGSTSSAQTVTVTNPGPLGLQITHVQASGDFVETNNCGASLSGTTNCTVDVTFAPTASGSRTGTLTITDSAPDSPQTVALSGTGENPSLGLGIASGSTSSAKVNPGSPANYSLSIGGSGISGTASLSCTGAPTGAVCSVPTTEQVSASTASNFTATVTTTAPGQSAARSRSLRNKPWISAFALFGFIFLPRITRRCTVLQVMCFVTLFVVMLCSCGGGGSTTPPQSSGTPAGTYTLTVTATSGNTTQTQNLSLVVQ